MYPGSFCYKYVRYTITFSDITIRITTMKRSLSILFIVFSSSSIRFSIFFYFISFVFCHGFSPFCHDSTIYPCRMQWKLLEELEMLSLFTFNYGVKTGFLQFVHHFLRIFLICIGSNLDIVFY